MPQMSLESPAGVGTGRQRNSVLKSLSAASTWNIVSKVRISLAMNLLVYLHEANINMPECGIEDSVMKVTLDAALHKLGTHTCSTKYALDANSEFQLQSKCAPLAGCS